MVSVWQGARVAESSAFFCGALLPETCSRPAVKKSVSPIHFSSVHRLFERDNLEKVEVPPELLYAVVNMEETMLDQ